jgi:hypothetical protein
VDSAHSVFKFSFFFLVQPFFDVKMSEIKRGLLPIDTTSSQASRVSSKLESPDCCDLHLLRIVDLENRVSTLKHQTRTAMEQAEKSSDLSKKVSSLEDQMSIGCQRRAGSQRGSSVVAKGGTTMWSSGGLLSSMRRRKKTTSSFPSQRGILGQAGSAG